MFAVTVKGLRAHAFRLAATALSVILGVSLMAGTLVLTDTVGAAFDDLFATVNQNTDAVVRSTEEVSSAGGGPAIRGTVPAAVLDDVEAVPGVAAAEGFTSGYAQFVGRDGEPIGNPGQGAPTLGFQWPRVAELNPFTLVEGDPPSSPDEVVVDKASADTGGFAVGDTITVLTKDQPREMTVAGIVKFGEVDSPLGASVALFEPDTAAELLVEPGTYSEIDVVAAEDVSQEQLAADLAAAVPDGIEALSGAEYVAEQQSDTREGLAFFNTFLLVFAGVALFVGSFIIYNTFSIIVAQRSRELALLRALGASRRQVRWAVVLEAVVIGVLASAVGVLAGIGMATLLKGLLAAFGIDIPAGANVLSAATVVTALVVGTAITVVSALLPARRASRVPPVAALREEALDESGTSKVRIAVGSVITALGAGALLVGLFGDVANGLSLVGLGMLVTFLGVAALGPVLARPVAHVLGAPLPALRGVAGRLARENAARSPRRTSSTAAALMVGVALVGFITIFAASARASISDVVDESFTGDFVVASGGFGPGSGFSEQLADDLRAVDGVAAVSPLRRPIAEVDGTSAAIPSLDIDEATRLADVKPVDGSLDDLGVDTIAISTVYAEDEGLGVGDTVDVRFPETGDQTFTVVATYENQSLAGPYFMSTAAQEANAPGTLDSTIYVGLEEGVDPVATRAAVEEAASTYPTAEVQDLTEFKAAQSAPIDQLLGLIYVLLLLAVIIALIGIANTLALSILERTRELGVLRAVGMTRRQLRSSVRWESVIIALFGAVLGLVIGVFFGWAMVRAAGDLGFSTLRVPVPDLVVVAVLAALAGVVAAIFPARRAARLDVLRAVTTE